MRAHKLLDMRETFTALLN